MLPAASSAAIEPVRCATAEERPQGFGAHRRLKAALLAAAAVAAICTAPAYAAGTEATVALELNKMEKAADRCRFFFLTDNPSPTLLQSLKLDLIFFGTDGVIAQRLAVELGPLAPARKRVKAFDLENRGCDTIGSVLLNDVLECRGLSGPVPDCLGRLKITSRAKAQFTK